MIHAIVTSVFWWWAANCAGLLISVFRMIYFYLE